jgi:hypothetical protein
MPAWLAAWAVLAAACQDAPTQTHIVLQVHVARAIAAQVTSIVVHGQKQSGATTVDVSEASADYDAGETPRFVLQPATGRDELHVRIVALHDREEVASATLTSWYSAGRGLYLDIELGCSDAYDLGGQQASGSPGKPIDSCDFTMLKTPRAGSGGAGGKSGSGGAPAAGSGGAGSGGAGAGGGGGAGGGAGASGDGASGTESTSRTGAAGGSGTAAGAGGAGQGPVSGAGAAGGGGSSGSAAGSGGAGSGGAGAGGAGVGGVGGAAGGGGTGGGPGTGCLTWRTIATISDAIETLSPEAFIAGIEHRDTPTEDIKQFICRASPAGLTEKLVGKASKWGCYLPGPGTTAYTVMENVEILISSNTAPCLTWKPLSPAQPPTSPLIFGDGSGATHVCRVSHAGVAEGRDTSGERIGQVRLESAQYVCRYEFYYYVENMTHVNLAGETTQVLDLAP